MGFFKTYDGFIRTLLIISAMMTLIVGSSLCCLHTQQPNPVPNICDKAFINPDGVHLNVPLLLQGTDCRWCWAADVSMIGTYYSKKSVRVCDIVTHTTTVTVTAITATGTMTIRLDCCAPDACATPCNHGGKDSHILEAFHFVGYPHTKISGIISENHLKIELSSGRPVMQEIRSTIPTMLTSGKKEYGRHVRIVSSFTPPKPPETDTTFEVLDSNYRLPLKRTYNQLLIESKNITKEPFIWEATWVLTATAAPECK